MSWSLPSKNMPERSLSTIVVFENSQCKDQNQQITILTTLEHVHTLYV